MDWKSKKSWVKEDLLYSPKRIVNNKGSRNHHHIIGSMPSRKMNRHIPYESLWGECLFYYLLELDPLTIRYYPQPESIEWNKLNSNHVLVKKEHVPDILAYRQGFKPHLYQVKGGDTFIQQAPHLYQVCIDHCKKKGWDYSVVQTKQLLPDIVKRNIQFIMHFMQPRPNYEIYIPEILKKIKFFGSPSIDYVAKSFNAKADFRDILPIMYYLIFIGELRVDLLSTINQFSEISLGNLENDLKPYFEWRVN